MGIYSALEYWATIKIRESCYTKVMHSKNIMHIPVLHLLLLTALPGWQAGMKMSSLKTATQHHYSYHLNKCCDSHSCTYSYTQPQGWSTTCSVGMVGQVKALRLYLESSEILSRPQQLVLQLQCSLLPVHLQLVELQGQPLSVLPGRHPFWLLTNDRKSL